MANTDKTESDFEWDVSTTPTWARVPCLILLMFVIIYFAACYHYAVQDKDTRPRWALLGAWHMFTRHSTLHADLGAQVHLDGKWVETDLKQLFPTTWETGYRFSRPAFHRDEHKIRVLAASVCRRHPDKPDRVRIFQVTWPKTLGSAEQPKRNVSFFLLLDYQRADGESVPLPGGRSL